MWNECNEYLVVIIFLLDVFFCFVLNVGFWIIFGFLFFWNSELFFFLILFDYLRCVKIEINGDIKIIVN